MEIIDWKTDLTRENHDEYEKQLEIYNKGIEILYPDRETSINIFYTSKVAN